MTKSYAGRNLMSRSFVNRVARGVTRGQDARMKLGAAIKAIRDDKKLTLDDLADMTGTTKANLSRIESGQWPRPELLESLAAALEVRIYQLFARAEGVTLPTSDETSHEHKVLAAYRVMEPEARYHLEAVADALMIVGGKMVAIEVKETSDGMIQKKTKPPE